MINKLKKILYLVFPIFTIQFKEFWDIIKESEYIKTWFLGLLAIGLILIMSIIIFSFIFWNLPDLSSMLLMEDGGWFLRALFVLYSFLVLFVTRDEL